MVGFFKKKNRNSVSLGNGGKSSSSPALVNNNNEYILYSSTELPNYDQFQNNHHNHLSKGGSKEGSSFTSSPSLGSNEKSSSSSGQHSYGGVSFGNDNSFGNNHPVTPPSPRHHLNHHHHINGGNNSNNNSFSKKSVNSVNSNGSSSSKKNNNNNNNDKNSIGSSGSKDNLMTPPPTTTPSSQPVSSYSEKDVFPNGVKRALKGIMLMGEGNEDVVKRARTYISHNGDIHFTQEDLPQYMLPDEYEEDIYQPLQLHLPNIKPLSTHGFDSDTDTSDKESGGGDDKDSDDLYFDEIQKRSNWANGLSNWTPKSPVQVSQQYSKESPLDNLRHLIYEEDKPDDDDDDDIENKFVIPKEELDQLFLNETNDDEINNDEVNEDDQQLNEDDINDNSSRSSDSNLDYNIEDVDVEITQDDIRTSDPIIHNNNNNNKNAENIDENKEMNNDDEILIALNQTIKLSSNLSSNNIIINNINNSVNNSLVSQLPPFTRNSSSISLNNSPSPYKVSSKLPSQVSTISKSILKDLDSSDNDILQSLELVIDSPQVSTSRIQSIKSPLQLQSDAQQQQNSTYTTPQKQNQQQLPPQSPLSLNRDSGKIDILGGFEDILNQSFKNARKSILFEKKIIDIITPNNSTNDLNIFRQQIPNLQSTSPPPPLMAESATILASDLEKSDLQSSYSGLERLKIDIQNLDISSNIANFDTDSKSNLDFSNDYLGGVALGIINNSTSFNNIDELEHDNDDSLSEITHDDSSEDSSAKNNMKTQLEVIAEKEEPFDNDDNSSTFSSNDDSLPVLTGNRTTNHTFSDSSDNEEMSELYEIYEVDEVIENEIQDQNQNQNQTQDQIDSDNDIQNILDSIPNILIHNNDDNCIYFKENENPYDIYSPPSSTDEVDYDNYSHISSVRGIKKDSLLSINTSSIGRTLSNTSFDNSENNSVHNSNNSNNNSQRQRSNSKSSYNSSLSELSELLVSLERKKPVEPIQETNIIQDNDNDSEEEFELKITKNGKKTKV